MSKPTTTTVTVADLESLDAFVRVRRQSSNALIPGAWSPGDRYPFPADMEIRTPYVPSHLVGGPLARTGREG